MVELGEVYAKSSAGALVSAVHGTASDLTLEAFETAAEVDAEICFLSLPHGESIAVAPALLEAGKIVIDLSGDHRLKDGSLYQTFYKKAPASEAMLALATYGLPEWSFQAIQSSRFIANPGCYATSAILALAPFVVEGLVDSSSIVINSMSGVSGAGRKAELEYSFVEVNENVRAYKVGDHQHTPEIESVLTELSGRDVAVTFTPHLIPITRGIYTTIVVPTREGVDTADLLNAARKHYDDKPFVRFSADRMPEIRRVTNTNYIDMTVRHLPERNQAIIISTLDNLVKGAAGQAIQNMNIACGWQETEGLL